MTTAAKPRARAGGDVPEQLELDLSAPGWCQRWRDRRQTWRRTSEGGFNPDLYRCVRLDGKLRKSARTFTIRHHYSGSWSPTRMAFGLQRLDRPPGPDDPPGGELVGVLALGNPMNVGVFSVFPDLQPYREALEIVRFVLLDLEPSNCESFFSAAALKLAAARGIRGVVAHADPLPRTRITDNGPELVTPGHVGHIYAVQDFAYLGRTRARQLVMLPDATVFPERSISKIRSNHRGHLGAQQRLEQLGARPRRDGEPGASWLADVLPTIGAVKIPHHGNHRFARTIGRHRTRIHLAAAAYPRPHQVDPPSGTP